MPNKLGLGLLAGFGQLDVQDQLFNGWFESKEGRLEEFNWCPATPIEVANGPGRPPGPLAFWAVPPGHVGPDKPVSLQKP